MAEAWIRAAAHAPAPWFVLVVTLLTFISVAGIPIPITLTLLLAGALTSQMPNGVAVFAALVICVALASTLHDMVARWIGVGSVALTRRRSAHKTPDDTISSPMRHPLRDAIQARWRRWLASPAQARALAAARYLLEKRGLAVLAIARMSILASPIDIAAGMLGVRLSVFALAVFIGRVPYAIILLGAGAISGAAISKGASVPTLVGIFSLIALVVIVLPTALSRRALTASYAATEEQQALTRQE